MTRSKSKLSPSFAWLLLLALAASQPALALQVVDARDGETVLAKVSRKEVTRISVDRGRIRKVTGNAGEFVLEKDDEKGQVFIRPVSPDSTKPINLFVSTERSTIGLLLQPVDIPSDAIVIREARDATVEPSRIERSGGALRNSDVLLQKRFAHDLDDLIAQARRAGGLQSPVRRDNPPPPDLPSFLDTVDGEVDRTPIRALMRGSMFRCSRRASCSAFAALGLLSAMTLVLGSGQLNVDAAARAPGRAARPRR